MLHKALAYMYAPRVLTLVATGVALPIMTSGLGAREYGLAAAVVALGGIIQVISDCGISAAVSRAITHAATVGNGATYLAVLRAWAKVQIAVVAVVFGLTIFAGLSFGEMLVSGASSSMILIVAGSLAVGTCNAFMRALLRTSLSFRRLAVMDVCESLSRSLAWIVVGLKFPHAVWLLLGELMALLVALSIGLTMCVGLLQRISRQALAESIEPVGIVSTNVSLRTIFAEGCVFLFIRLATTGLTQLPILIVSRMGRLEEAGLLAVLFRLVDLINGPIVVIGQVIGVKSVSAFKQGGTDAKCRLWHHTARICALWLPVIGGYVLLSTPLAHLMLPHAIEAPTAFALFGLFLMMHMLSSTFGLPIDYLGSAAQRLKLMVPVFVIQTVLIWIGTVRYGTLGMIVTIDLCYLCLVVGYMRLARRVMGDDAGLRMPMDAKILWVATALVVLTGLLLQRVANLTVSLAVVGGLAVLVAGGLAMIPTFRREYAPRRLLNLD